MKATLTIEFDSLAELRTFVTASGTVLSPAEKFRAFAQEPVATAAVEPVEPAAPVKADVTEAPVATAPAKKRGRPAKALPPVEAPTEPNATAPAQPAPEPMPQGAAERSGQPAEAPTAAIPQPDAGGTAATEAEARTALETVFEAKGFAGAQELLSKLGAQRLRDVPAAKYGELVALARGMLA
jgi:hypothetical protein